MSYIYNLTFRFLHVRWAILFYSNEVVNVDIFFQNLFYLEGHVEGINFNVFNGYAHLLKQLQITLQIDIMSLLSELLLQDLNRFKFSTEETAEQDFRQRVASVTSAKFFYRTLRIVKIIMKISDLRCNKLYL